ncbi:hypothetical protein ILFOPFJJ_06568 [Ensifer psoraleae]|nr:hypothetical protein [Sinorhizobium psoraleae]
MSAAKLIALGIIGLAFVGVFDALSPRERKIL